MSDMTFPWEKNLSTEKTEIAVKWTFKFCCVCAPRAPFLQFCLPGQQATRQQSLLLSGKNFLCQEKGEGEKKPNRLHVSPTAEYWGCGYGVRDNFQMIPKATLQGPGYCTRLVSSWRSTGATGELFSLQRFFLRCCRSQPIPLFR